MDLFPFVAGSYESRSKKFDCQRTVNLYAEASGSGNSKSIAMLIGTPGTVFWAISASGAPPLAPTANTRGAIVFSSTIMIGVLGPQICKYAPDSDVADTAQYLGAIVDRFTPVSMASNGQVIMLVTGGPEGYFIDPVAGTITQIADPAFVGADRVDFIDGYFVFNKLGTQQYQIIGPYTTTIDPLSFASAEGAPDLLVSVIVSNKEIVLLGETSTEFHFNSGNVDFPFEPIQGAFIGIGCAAKDSVAKTTDANGQSLVIWLSKNEDGKGMVMRNVGYQPQRISDHGIEYQIGQFSRIDDAIAYTYQQEGHIFYVLTFPTADRTFCYDFSTELWHERMSTEISRRSGGGFGDEWTNHRHISTCHVFFDNKNIVGTRATAGGTFGFHSFDLNTYTDLNGKPIYAIRQCPHLAADDAWLIFDEIWFDMEVGVGLNDNVSFAGVADITSVGKDPQMLLEWSDDGGYTFPNSRLIPLGKIGQKQIRATARRLGKSKDRVFRTTIVDPVRRCFIGAGTRTRVGAR